MGTKKAVVFLAAPQLCAWILSFFAKNKWTFYVMRFIGGIGDTWFFCSIPAYVGEISTPTVRGYFGNVPTFIFFGGEEFITVIGSYLGVKITAYICMPIPVLFAILVTFVLPESPYQLIKDGKLDEARESIKWLRRKADIEDDFQKMEADVIRQISEPGTWKDLFTIPSNRKALRAGAFLRFTQLLSGIAIFVFYTQSLFEKAGGSISPQCSSIIFMGLLWTLNLVFSPGVEKFGRKLTYCYSSASSGVILLIMAAYFFLDQYQIVNLDPIKWFPLAGMIAFAFAYSFGQGIIPTLMLGELFSASIKLKGLAVIMTVFGISSFLTTTLFNVFTATIGLYSSFLVYGICCIITSVLTLRWVPETKGKTLEEIQQGLKN